MKLIAVIVASLAMTTTSSASTVTNLTCSISKSFDSQWMPSKISISVSVNKYNYIDFLSSDPLGTAYGENLHIAMLEGGVVWAFFDVDEGYKIAWGRTDGSVHGVITGHYTWRLELNRLTGFAEVWHATGRNRQKFSIAQYRCKQAIKLF